MKVLQTRLTRFEVGVPFIIRQAVTGVLTEILDVSSLQAFNECQERVFGEIVSVMSEEVKIEELQKKVSETQNDLQHKIESKIELEIANKRKTWQGRIVRNSSELAGGQQRLDL